MWISWNNKSVLILLMHGANMKIVLLAVVYKNTLTLMKMTMFRLCCCVAGLHRDGNAHVLRWPQWHVWTSDLEFCKVFRWVLQKMEGSTRWVSCHQNVRWQGHLHCYQHSVQVRCPCTNYVWHWKWRSSGWQSCFVFQTSYITLSA